MKSVELAKLEKEIRKNLSNRRSSNSLDVSNKGWSCYG